MTVLVVLAKTAGAMAAEELPGRRWVTKGTLALGNCGTQEAARQKGQTPLRKTGAEMTGEEEEMVEASRARVAGLAPPSGQNAQGRRHLIKSCEYSDHASGSPPSPPPWRAR